MTQIAFVSDAHIRHSDDPQAMDLLKWIDTITVDRICFMGDIFDIFWDYEGGHFSQRTFLNELSVRLKSGLVCDFLPGNRDFSAANFFRRHGARVADQMSYDCLGLRVLAAHGDQGDRRPGYRLTRMGLRSAPFRRVMSWFGPTKGYRFLNRIAGASREHMSLDESVVIQQTSWADKQLKVGYDVVLLGHSHRLKRIACPNGELILTGNWQCQRHYVVFDGQAFQEHSF